MTPHDKDSPFLDRLGAHLQRAAETGPRRPARQIPLAIVVAILAVGLVAGLFGSLVRSGPGYAQGLTITIGDEAIEVEVHAPITDLSVPLRQLREAGVAVEAVENPTPDWLIGHITSLLVIRGEMEWEPAAVSEGESVNRFTVREGEQLVIYVGRKAKPGEAYESTEAPAACARWRDRPVSEVRADIETTLGSLRWQLFDGRVVTEISEPEPDHLIQDAFPLSDASGLVLVSLTPDAIPAHAHCAPNP